MQNKDTSHCTITFDVTSYGWYIQLCVFKQAPARVKQVAPASFSYGRLTNDIEQQPVSAQLQRRPMQNRACGHAIPKQRSGNMQKWRARSHYTANKPVVKYDTLLIANLFSAVN
jgi:hypothetical protein